MKTKFIIILIAISVTGAFAQTDSLTFKKEIGELNKKILLLESKVESIQSSNNTVLQENGSLKKSQSDLNKSHKMLLKDFDNFKIQSEDKIDSLQIEITKIAGNIDKTANDLGVKIDTTEKTTNQSITKLNKSLSQNTLYWIIAILAVALFVLLVFILLRKQIFKQRTDLDSNLQDTRKVLEEEGVKLDNKLIEVLEKQLNIINSNNSGTEKEADHTLALKVADEIIRIQKNLTRMDENTKGLKQLISSVKRIQDNFASNGYELVEMLGKQYNDGMKASVNFIPDEDLEKGKQVISRIIKPQVNYKGVMIQTAQIEVSQGE